MTITFRTESGSEYQVERDAEGNWRVRRAVRSKASRSERVGEDWRPLAAAPRIDTGRSVLFIWASDVPLLPETAALLEVMKRDGHPLPADLVSRVTVTTPVTSIVHHGVA